MSRVGEEVDDGIRGSQCDEFSVIIGLICVANWYYWLTLKWHIIDESFYVTILCILVPV